MMYHQHQKANWPWRCLHVSSRLQLGKEFELVQWQYYEPWSMIRSGITDAGDDNKQVLWKEDGHFVFWNWNCRFPIPDLRTGQGVDRLPWWTRSLRSEVAVLELSDAELQSTFCAAEPYSKFEFTCRDAHGLFQEAADKPLMSFIRITTEDTTVLEGEQGFNWPRYLCTLDCRICHGNQFRSRY